MKPTTIAEKLAEAHAERQLESVQEKIVTVDGRQVTLYSLDNQHWFSRKADIARWQAAKAARARAYERPSFNPKVLGRAKKWEGTLPISSIIDG